MLSAQSLVYLPALVRSPFNIRQPDETTPEFAQLIASIRANGLLEPLVVCACGHDPARFEVLRLEGMGEETIASRFGISLRGVRQRLALLRTTQYRLLELSEQAAAKARIMAKKSAMKKAAAKTKSKATSQKLAGKAA